jgi:hypothetical protein
LSAQSGIPSDMPTLSEEETNTHLSSAIQAAGPSPLSGKGGHLGELLTMSMVFGVCGLGFKL